MNHRPFQTHRSLADGILELADAFGLFASVFCLEQHTTETRWADGSLRGRSARFDESAAVTIVTPSGEVGHACVRRIAPKELEQAFHEAREAAVTSPFRTEMVRRFVQFEQNLPPPALPPDDDVPLPEGSVSRAAETHHRQLAERLPGRTQSSCAVSREYWSAIRSDGACHHVPLWRVICRNEWHPSPVAAPVRWCAGSSGLAHTPPSPPDVLAELESSLTGIVPAIVPAKEAPVPVAARTLPTHETLWLDGGIFARIAHAWLSSPRSRPTRFWSVNMVIEQTEGTPGYSPLHPYGYVWGPLPLAELPVYGSSRGNSARAAEWLMVGPPAGWGGHLSLRLPTLTDQGSGLSSSWSQAVSRLPARGEDGPDGWIVMEGVRHFWWNDDTAAFALLPARTSLHQGGKVKPLSPAWWCAPADAVLAECIGGAGADRYVWTDPETAWTATVPAFVGIRLNGEPLRP